MVCSRDATGAGAWILQGFGERRRWSVVDEALENAGFDRLGGCLRQVTWQVTWQWRGCGVGVSGGLGGMFIYEGLSCSGRSVGDMKC